MELLTDNNIICKGKDILLSESVQSKSVSEVSWHERIHAGTGNICLKAESTV